MKKSITIVLIVAILVIATIGFCGCDDYTETEEDIKNESMFVVIERTGDYQIVYHKETFVMYAVSYGGYSNGIFSLLVNADGTPMLYEEDKND